MLGMTVVQGADAIEAVELLDREGAPIAYTGTETLSLRLSKGDGLAVVTLTTSAATWLAAPRGRVRIWLTKVDTATFTPGSYYVYLAVVAGTLRSEGVVATLEVVAAPAAVTAGKVYCTLDDVKRFAPWIERTIPNDISAQSDLGEYRARARTWLDEQILARARARVETQAELHAPVLAVDPIEITTGYDAGPSWGPSVYPDTTVQDQLDDIQTHLDADKLVVDAKVKEITAKYTIHLLCDVQIGDGPSETPYQVLAKRFRSDALYGLVGWIARLDTDSDGDADFMI
ncbi:MAG: hypothetical protein AB7G11_02715 [Phycisphaerales bacterium]